MFSGSAIFVPGKTKIGSVYYIFSRSESFPRIQFYSCPGVQKLYFCTAASPGDPMQKYSFCTPPETFRSTDTVLGLTQLNFNCLNLLYALKIDSQYNHSSDNVPNRRFTQMKGFRRNNDMEPGFSGFMDVPG
jgi:hypothetical protein